MRLMFCILLCLGTASIALAEEATFVGSKACADCHDEQYENFMAHSKKATSWKSIAIMASDLKPAEIESCYECHTTGYGKPGGFVNIETTPHLADVGCETCHGPGSVHAETGDVEDLVGELNAALCETCHSDERVGDFNFKPLLYSGAH